MTQLPAPGLDHAGAREDPPRYPVRAVALRLGIPTATLRSWNQRYGIGPSHHRPGRHRLYSTADIATVEHMRDLIDKGVNPRGAARVALASVVPQRADTASLVAAAFELDVPAAGELIDKHLRHFGVLATWDELIRPVFAIIDARQSSGERCIDVEHALSWTVSRALQAISSTRADSSAPILLACTASESHTLALEALRAALDERGREAVMLGADVPAEALVGAIERRTTEQVTVVLWSQQRETADIAAAQAVLKVRTNLVVAGEGWASARLPRKAARAASLSSALERLRSS